MMMLVLTVCSFEGTWNIDRNEKQCESAVFFMYISDEDCVSHGKNAGGILDKSI